MVYEFQTLWIQDGKIDEIDTNAFAGLPYVTNLLIVNCELKKPPQLNLLKGNLTYLSLDYNSINGFSQNYFRGFLALQFFGADRNCLTSIPSINELASHLQTLTVTFNRISAVTGEWCENDTIYESLNSLQLEGNYIISVEARIIKILPNMKFLDLSVNFITHFEDPSQYLVERSWKFTIALAMNPLDCRSHLAWVVSVPQVVGDATCKTPVCLNGSALHAMSMFPLKLTFNTLLFCCDDIVLFNEMIRSISTYPTVWLTHSRARKRGATLCTK